VEKVLISFGCRFGKGIREMLDMAKRDEAREGVACGNKMTHLCLLLRWRFYSVSLFLVLLTFLFFLVIIIIIIIIIIICVYVLEFSSVGFESLLVSFFFGYPLGMLQQFS
jgi:hypothetical protein